MIRLKPQQSAQLFFTLSGLNLITGVIRLLQEHWIRAAIELSLCAVFFIVGRNYLKKHRASPGDSDASN
jgi:hypothetical protein